jgi:TolB protein
MYSFIIILSIFSALSADQIDVSTTLAITAHGQSRIPIHCIWCTQEGDRVYQEALIRALEFSGQCTITAEVGNLPIERAAIKAERARGYPLVLYADPRQESGYVWRLYDTATGQMLGGKRYQKADKKISGNSLAHHAADDIHRLLHGKPGPFCSRIAYVQTEGDSVTRAVRSIVCSVAYDGTDCEELLISRQVIVAPFFHPAARSHTLFYSEFTPTNVRIMALDGARRIRSVIDWDGTHVGIGMARERSEVVYCSSGQIWCCAYDPIARAARHVMVVDRYKGSPCASPNLLPDGTVVFCAGGALLLYDPSTKQVSPITAGCYAVSPAYSPEMHAIAYSRRVDGVFQIYWYDCASKTHMPVTTGNRDAVDPAISPCGNYIAYVRDEGKTTSIIVEHRGTHMQHRITPPGKRCAYPVWSSIVLD